MLDTYTDADSQHGPKSAPGVLCSGCDAKVQYFAQETPRETFLLRLAGRHVFDVSSQMQVTAQRRS